MGKGKTLEMARGVLKVISGRVADMKLSQAPGMLEKIGMMKATVPVWQHDFR